MRSLSTGREERAERETRSVGGGDGERDRERLDERPRVLRRTDSTLARSTSASTRRRRGGGEAEGERPRAFASTGEGERGLRDEREGAVLVGAGEGERDGSLSSCG